ncbi:MAG: YlbF family regulator [Ruminococcus sp.]|nr:YlbF family regulator [Ruminococcus sp.]
MDIIEMTRELGKALQTDDRYIAYNLAKQVNDEDKELQEQIDSFEKMRYDLNMELTKENKDTDKIKDLDENIKATYNKIMSNKNMIVFSAAQKSLESLVGNIQEIITMCANGEDPATCEPSTGCTGSCATCGGCH